MTDGQGHSVDFRNTVIIMTSNIGTQFAQKGGALGFQIAQESDEMKSLRKQVEEGLRSTFRPEFLNRIDEVIIFHPLTKAQVKQIVDLQMHEIRERLSEHGLTIELTEEAREWLAARGYDPEFGARPLRRVLQREVENALSKKLLAGDFQRGDTVTIGVAEGALIFQKAKSASRVEAEAAI
jgi:ATP-dependent Clp protease ATP-binding subunit ClpC